nr:hypothetical protein [Tanacetum cinerariifolium]
MEISESEEPEKKKTKRQKSTYKETMKKSGSKKNSIIEESPKIFTRGDAKRQAEFENVDQQNKVEDDEDVKSISSDDVIVKTKKKGRKSKGKKEGKKMKKEKEETQVKSEEHVIYEGSNSHNERFPVVNKDCFVRDNWINGWSFDWVRNIISGPNASQLALLQNTISAFTLNDSEDSWA